MHFAPDERVEQIEQWLEGETFQSLCVDEATNDWVARVEISTSCGVVLIKNRTLDEYPIRDGDTLTVVIVPSTAGTTLGDAEIAVADEALLRTAASSACDAAEPAASASRGAPQPASEASASGGAPQPASEALQLSVASFNFGIDQGMMSGNDLLNSTIPKWAQFVPGIPKWAQSVLQPTKDSVPLDDHPTGWGTRPYRDTPEPQSPTWETVSHLSKTFLDYSLRYTHAEGDEEAPEPDDVGTGARASAAASSEDQSRGKTSTHRTVLQEEMAWRWRIRHTWNRMWWRLLLRHWAQSVLPQSRA